MKSGRSWTTATSETVWSLLVKLSVPTGNFLIRGLQSGGEVLRQCECNLAEKISVRSKAFFCLPIRRRNGTE